MGRHPLGRRHQLPVDHQQAVVQAPEEGFHNDPVTVLLGLVIGLFQLFLVVDVGGDAAAVVGVQGLDHHRVADPLRHPQRPPQPVHQRLPRHGEPEVAEDAVGLVLLRGQFDGDMLGGAGDRRLQALLVATVPKLNQAVIVEPDPWDIAFFCSRTDSFLDIKANAGAELGTP